MASWPAGGVSDCCEAPVVVEGRTTRYHVCTGCGKACDAVRRVPMRPADEDEDEGRIMSNSLPDLCLRRPLIRRQNEGALTRDNLYEAPLGQFPDSLAHRFPRCAILMHEVGNRRQPPFGRVGAVRYLCCQFIGYGHKNPCPAFRVKSWAVLRVGHEASR